MADSNNYEDIEVTDYEMLEMKLISIGLAHRRLRQAAELSSEYFVGGDIILSLLNEAADIALSEDEKELYKLCCEMRWVCMSRWSTNDDKKEGIYHILFDWYAEELLKEYHIKVCEGPYFDAHNQPDSWVTVEGKYIPVEVKLRDFNDKALKQLQRYMRVFKCNQGIAVGERYTAKEKPENIIFVQNEDLKQAYLRDHGR